MMTNSSMIKTTDNDICYQQIVLDNKMPPITVKRIDLIHSKISGNKYYKLKYNLEFAKQNHHKQIISFGGAYSNHIHALAYACHELNLKSIGIIRGKELANKPLNQTLQEAQDMGMKLEFVTRQEYRLKNHPSFLNTLIHRYPDSYVIPEGGTNHLAIKGCEEILSVNDTQAFDIVCCAVGTGGTISGIINSSSSKQKVIGFSALNSDYQKTEILKWTKGHNNWQLRKDDYFGGYAKYSGERGQELFEFMKQIKKISQVPLEPIYTGKALFYLRQHLLSENISTNQRVLFIHSGGLQGFRH